MFVVGQSMEFPDFGEPAAVRHVVRSKTLTPRPDVDAQYVAVGQLTLRPDVPSGCGGVQEVPLKTT